jgi:hypothetical protein
MSQKKETLQMKFKNALKLLLVLSALPHSVWASDHDDGENDRKARSLNLTDVYLFRKDSQTHNDADRNKTILIMNSNPRSLPQQQYYFSSAAHYDFHVTRVGVSPDANNIRPTGSDDIRLRLTFGEPDAATKKQAITVLTSINGTVTTVNQKVGGGSIQTTPLGTSPINNDVAVGLSNIVVFAGLRQDPFFFDVQGFFKFRSTLNPAHLSSPDGDFTLGYNVNTIALEVPTSLLQTDEHENVFDVWATISVPKK